APGTSSIQGLFSQPQQPQPQSSTAGGPMAPPPQGGYYNQHHGDHFKVHAHQPQQQYQPSAPPAMQNIPLFNPSANSTPIASAAPPESGFIRMFDPSAYAASPLGFNPVTTATT